MLLHNHYVNIHLLASTFSLLRNKNKRVFQLWPAVRGWSTCREGGCNNRTLLLTLAQEDGLAWRPFWTQIADVFWQCPCGWYVKRWKVSLKRNASGGQLLWWCDTYGTRVLGGRCVCVSVAFHTASQESLTLSLSIAYLSISDALFIHPSLFHPSIPPSFSSSSIPPFWSSSSFPLSKGVPERNLSHVSQVRKHAGGIARKKVFWWFINGLISVGEEKAL